MSEVLSQSQIDALINSMKSGTADNSSTENKENKYKRLSYMYIHIFNIFTTYYNNVCNKCIKNRLYDNNF